ncbi:YD repeat-containing protein [Rhodococcus sp. SMB37]|uniref:hypothetical protein n=1 Tax=Rhodococcus sp. SMB37 TaxID=2512213 RepID=UPI00104708BF|nr:hypothetical protein [Rhodococcus sp. SMB37]TCN51794.1 YD repeat-containing protein [Rhodococcus sp. SMB37]
MAYIPSRADWKNLPDRSTPIMAENLEHIEQGIVDAHEELDGRLSESSLNATYVRAFPDSTAVVYDGENVSSVTEDGITTTYTYNPDGSVATDTRAGVTRTYTYDTAGNLTEIEVQ